MSQIVEHIDLQAGVYSVRFKVKSTEYMRLEVVTKSANGERLSLVVYPDEASQTGTNITSIDNVAVGKYEMVFNGYLNGANRMTEDKYLQLQTNPPVEVLSSVTAYWGKDEEKGVKVTIKDMKDYGLRVSTLMSEEELKRAVDDVVEAYIVRLKPDFDPMQKEVKEAVMQIAFILMCQRNAVLTRSGAKDKMSPQMSERGSYNDSDVRNADRLLRKLTEKDPSLVVDDICSIYFGNVYFGINR